MTRKMKAVSEDTQVETIHGVEELRRCPYHMMGSIDFSKSVAACSVRTCILDEHSGVVEVDHSWAEKD